MRRFIVPAAVFTTAAVVLAFRPAPEATIEASDLEGAWKTVTVHAELADTTWTRDEDRPNMLLFVDGHWAAMRVRGEGTRADLPEDPTDEQRIEAWRRFSANGGTYAVSGSTITSTTLISKTPNAMNDQRTGSNEFKLDGDKLVRVFKNEENGNSWTVTYERM